MAMVNTGPISLGGNATTGGLNQSVNIELGRAATATINMDESAVRGLAGIPSGAIGLSSFYGKSSVFNFSFNGGTDINLRNAALAAGWNGSSAVVATNNGTVQASSTGTPALTISGSFPGGLSFINNALIVGRGGNGGRGGGFAFSGQNSTAGGSGGVSALSVSTAVTITNNSTIAGGGGGGGGAGGNQSPSNSQGGGGGGGGIGVSLGGPSTQPGPGAPGPSVGNPGNAGTTTAAGTGGTQNPTASTARGGNGGGYASSGNGGSPGRSSPASGGGAGGAAVVGNSFITWAVVGTRIGALN